ncbi:MAG: hypothetical protein IPF99_33800 [Deltaproteobacteria bacterium]|nr:hypothetical protein [Deltaproteobacteria bacterium]
MRVVPTVLSVILVGSRASAQTVDPEVLMRGGVEARHARRDDAALQLFTQAYDITHSARALAQVGLAEQALGRWAGRRTISAKPSRRPQSRGSSATPGRSGRRSAWLLAIWARCESTATS